MWKAPRQCAVVFQPDATANPTHGRKYLLKMGPASFLLHPPPELCHGNGTSIRLGRLSSLRRDPLATLNSSRVPTNLDLPRDGMLASAASVAPSEAHPSDNWIRSSLEPEANNAIRSLRIRPLGRGGQGSVHEVVDLHNGAHYACKSIVIRTADSRTHIAPYLYYQGLDKSPVIKLFMPVFDGCLYDALHQQLGRNESTLAMVFKMLRHILIALDKIHTHDPPLVHNDVKPQNILFRKTAFFLAAQATFVEPTSKIDIYALGATVVDCLGGLAHGVREPDFKRNSYHEQIKAFMAERVPKLADMVADRAEERPTAKECLDRVLCMGSLETLAPTSNPEDGTGLCWGPSPMEIDWPEGRMGWPPTGNPLKRKRTWRSAETRPAKRRCIRESEEQTGI
ncbi:protein kinase-like protein [Niveomyces insectorum RCEF 264]|uniref:Protein kinase-like protein n=1 Tax=Niveomyces insectorum RCEF 264 TaxID=1081102 RepID=A0A162ML41_9HYPO|nr:protein kinase-like protein [Niveomyces insectorum RCEF 264]